MKKFLFFFTLTIFSHTMLSQENEDSRKLEELKNELNSRAEEIILSQFALGPSLANLGQYASLSTQKDILTASFYLIKEKNFAKATLTGGSQNGISNFFSAGKMNTSVGIGLDYYILPKKVEYDRDTDYILSLENELEKYLELYNKSIQKVEEAKRSISSLNAEKIKLEQTKSGGNLSATELKKLEGNLRSINDKIDSLNNLRTNERIVRNNITDKIAEISNDKLKEAPIFVKKMNLINLGGAINFNDIMLIDPMKETDEQFVKEDYQKLSLQVNYIWIRQNSERDGPFKLNSKKYFSFGIAGLLDSNLSALKKVTIRDQDSIGLDRIAYLDQVGFIGDFDKEVLSGSVNAEYLHFFAATEKVGVHLKANHILLENHKPRTEFQVGAVFSFLKKDKPFPIVNLEIFYTLKDFFSTSPVGSANRQPVIGLQTTFPFLSNI